MDHAGIKISIQPSSIDIILPFGNFLIFVILNRTCMDYSTFKKLKTLCFVIVDEDFNFPLNQNRVPSIIVCQNESFYGKTSWLIVLKEKCCWNDLILKGEEKGDERTESICRSEKSWCLLHFSISNAATYWWSYCYCPEMKMLKYPCQGTHTTLCYVCECNTVCTMSMKKELCHFSSSQMTIFSREMKIFVNERNHRKMREILQKGQST